MLLWHSGWRHMASLLALPFCTIAFSQEKTPFICQIGRYGDFSYGMYLFAFPVQQMIVFLFSETLNFYAILALSFIITVGLSYLSWHLIEKPFLRMKPRKKESTFTYLNRTMGPIIKLLIPMSLSNQESSPAPVSSSEKIIFLKIFSSIALIYIAYIFIYWPGILGQDGLALILEAEGVQKSGKTPAWILFFNILYKPWRLVEVPIIIQLIICAILLSRILSWLHANNLYKSFWFCLVFIAIAPHLVFYNASLYSDGIYACALSSLLFEIWLTSKNKILTKHSFFILTLSAPFAIFGRPNGIINLIPLVAIIFLLGHKKEKIAIAGLIALCLAITFGASRHYKPHSIGSLFPMAIWETVNFLQPSVMNVHPPHVSELTIKTLEERKPIPDIIKYYDRDYWDPLYFFPTGPIVGALSKESQDTIIKEFYRYNLWVNLPRFISSRVHVFLVAAFAHGGFPGPTYAKHILEQTQSQSVYRLWNLTTLETLLTKIHDFNFKYRSLLWSPFLGIFLVLVTFYMSIKHKNIPSLIVSGTLFLQLLAIFFFSIAGEYRYLMSFFTAPLVMLPVFADFKKQPHQS